MKFIIDLPLGFFTLSPSPEPAFIIMMVGNVPEFVVHTTVTRS